MGRKPFITLDDVAIQLYDQVLFEHTDWEILEDQHWAVIGPNGAGKSTLLRLRAGRAIECGVYRKQQCSIYHQLEFND